MKDNALALLTAQTYHQGKRDCVDRLVETERERVALLLGDVTKGGPARLADHGIVKVERLGHEFGCALHEILTRRQGGGVLAGCVFVRQSHGAPRGRMRPANIGRSVARSAPA